jgi:hypothetical protein
MEMLCTVNYKGCASINHAALGVLNTAYAVSQSSNYNGSTYPKIYTVCTIPRDE